MKKFNQYAKKYAKSSVGLGVGTAIISGTGKMGGADGQNVASKSLEGMNTMAGFMPVMSTAASGKMILGGLKKYKKRW